MRNLFLGLFVCLITLNTYAQLNTALDNVPNPGNTGAYAFSFVDHANDAQIGDDIIIDVRFDAGKDKLGSIQGGFLRIKIPFAHWVEIEANVSSDVWQISEETRERYNIISTRGAYEGDVNFKTKVKILSDNPDSIRPAVAFQGTVKAAAGDFASTHRYTDSAGYEFSILGSKVLMDSDDTIIRKVKILTEAGFVAWDTGLAEQNDSFKASTAIQVEGKNFKFKVSWLGLYGWQDPKLDHVSTLQFEGAVNVRKNVQVYSQVNLGLSQAATPYMIGAGVRFYLPAPKKKKKFIPPIGQ